MKPISADSPSAFSGPGPFHGNKAQYATVFTWLIAFEWLMLFFSPWLVAFSSVYSRSQSFLAALPMSAGRLCFLDLLGCASALSFWTLLKRLHARIARGGTEAAFLDEIRYHVVSLVLGFLMLMIVLIIFWGSSRQERGTAARHALQHAAFSHSGTMETRTLQ